MGGERGDAASGRDENSKGRTTSCLHSSSGGSTSIWLTDQDAGDSHSCNQRNPILEIECWAASRSQEEDVALVDERREAGWLCAGPKVTLSARQACACSFRRASCLQCKPSACSSQAGAPPALQQDEGGHESDPCRCEQQIPPWLLPSAGLRLVAIRQCIQLGSGRVAVRAARLFN